MWRYADLMEDGHGKYILTVYHCLVLGIVTQMRMVVASPMISHCRRLAAQTPYVNGMEPRPRVRVQVSSNSQVPITNQDTVLNELFCDVFE